MKRFYKDVAVGDDFSVLLDGRPVKTPKKTVLALPTRAMAELVAEEWRAQGEEIAAAAMVRTKCANTAIDKVKDREEITAESVLAFANDLLCYRAESPSGLVARQSAGWDPLLDWAAERFGARLRTGFGVVPIDQDEAAVAALRRALAAYDAFALTALYGVVAILGSLVLALALAEGRLDADEAFALSRIDEDYQAERWGRDSEAEARARDRKAELVALAAFLEPAVRR
jgi:chaperone required for assembly of F1-ATPase